MKAEEGSNIVRSQKESHRKMKEGAKADKKKKGRSKKKVRLNREGRKSEERRKQTSKQARL